MRWSARILDEAERNLKANRSDPDRISRRFRLLRSEFDDWEIYGYDDLISAMKCQEKDRHVLAAAVRGAANQIVTHNDRDFPPDSISPYSIEVVQPDDFFLNVLDVNPKAVVEVIQAQAAALNRPPMTIDDVLHALSKAGAPEFSQQLANIIAASS